MAKHRAAPNSALNLRQQRFVAEYLKDPNATQAALRAGYSPKTAHDIGSENLTKPAILEAIQAGQAKLLEKAGITAERIIEEYKKIAFSDFRQFAKWGPDGVRLVDSEALSDESAACVAEVSETTSKDGGSIRFKLHDKKGALDSLAKHLGMFVERVDLTSKGKPIPIRVLRDEP